MNLDMIQTELAGYVADRTSRRGRRIGAIPLFQHCRKCRRITANCIGHAPAGVVIRCAACNTVQIPAISVAQAASFRAALAERQGFNAANASPADESSTFGGGK